MNLSDYYKYFEVFKQSGLIENIFNVDIFDLNQTIELVKRKGDGPHLIIEDPQVNTLAKSDDNVIDVYTGAAVVLLKLNARKDNASNRNDLLNSAAEITQQIKLKMIADKKSDVCNLMNNLQVARFQMDKIGPISDNLYGWRLQLEIYSPLNI